MSNPLKEDGETMDEQQLANCFHEVAMAYFEGERVEKRSRLRPADAYFHICFKNHRGGSFPYDFEAFWLFDPSEVMINYML